MKRLTSHCFCLWMLVDTLLCLLLSMVQTLYHIVGSGVELDDLSIKCLLTPCWFTKIVASNEMCSFTEKQSS